MNFDLYNNIIKMYSNKEITYDEFNLLLGEVVKEINSPLKEFYLLNSSYLRGFHRLNSKLIPVLLEYKDDLLNSDLISDADKHNILCSLVISYFESYNYVESEKIANLLFEKEINDYKILNELAIYYTKTRRLNRAESIYQKIIMSNNKDKVDKDYSEFLKVLCGTKRKYMPSSSENKIKYIDFISSLGIDIEENIRTCASSKQPSKIPVDEYPLLKEHMNPDFNSFVAFDLETTGFDSSKDAITEIGAIKVVDGKIVETKEYMFQELVHPYKKSIPKMVEIKTGISNEMVRDSRPIWDVFSDFAEFIGDNILVGYNCKSFDNKFIVRAGRLSNIIINNEYFDVMLLAKKYKKQIDSEKVNLNDVAKSFGIVNPQAHRALADAVTTAKVYLELYDLVRMK